ncbi:MAG TPA: CorA family divalent cation transporter, partial [Saprospiraceae bacterium]|nr:CorA family divalent cation transporter [Saprospiraceae bacterium]
MKHHRNPVNKKKKTGLSPGTLVYTGEQKSEQPLLSGIQYNVLNIEHLDETVCLKTKCQEGFQYWFDVRGIHDVELIARIGEQFNINKLILEDVMDPGQRIKIEDYDSAVFVVLSNLEYDKASSMLRKEQIAIYVTEQYLISFQENPDDTFSVLRDRMSMEGSKTRSRGTDYLLYAMLDYLVDKYFLILDAFSDEIEIQEERVYQKEFELSMEELYQLRNHIVSLKRLIFPLREEL